MRIYLYLNDKVLKFVLPSSVLGSFSFDENEEEEYKLINVEAKNSKWVLYSTENSSVMDNGTLVDSLELVPGNYYIVKRKDKNFLLYATNVFDDTFSTYSYGDDLNLTVGPNGSNCGITFTNSLVKEVAFELNKQHDRFTLKRNNIPIYINNNMLKDQTTVIKIGDTIEVFGLKIIFASGMLFINNPSNSVNINYDLTKLKPYEFKPLEKMEDIDIKDVDLYTKDDYYSKSPRIRRLIEKKKINFSTPPKASGETEMPLILTIGPMLTMAVVSIVRLATIITKIITKEATFESQILQLLTACAMLMASILWPSLTRSFNKKLKEKQRREITEKYTIYLANKTKEFENEELIQRNILNENLLSIDNCLEIMNQGKINFWDKRMEQNDFLEVNMGNGDVPLEVEVNFPEEEFTIEEDQLKQKAEALVNEYKRIRNVPVGYSFYKNKVTALMGNEQQMYGMINNIIIQLITFYSYEDLKIVVFTNNANSEKWDYLRYLNHTFSNDKSIRFFSTNYESAKRLSDFLLFEMKNRIAAANKNDSSYFKPYYLIITDDYYQIKRMGITKIITELDANIGFSLIIMEQRMSKLPSKCYNFITMSNGFSGILMNSFENQEQISFHDNINYDVDMMKIAKKLSNIPIEFEEGTAGLPESITFLEMEKVGKVEQLNILNRWNSNDSTQSLRAEIGVDEEENLMYLDLHEKYHGPHGLIAGMTGSGKSEFIITYILSMAMNYSPDDVAFILIDYKGGGLAGAFENKVTGVSLPHLAGVITNLDKAEMDRTLVSIDSEVKRRQKIFNEARDNLGESTIDIYKYQRFYKEGKISEPCPHLFIICDEFAELKSQQPDFMANLISVARIGRSLGVHLILATQKPSGVVNDQIWSNSKFKVCLKVQDTSDSSEMLKRPDAASLKQAGRFYLQVGYDEYFALGQSGWCGAKYYPSDTIIKQVDKSVNFIDDTGSFIKSVQASNNIKIEAQGEQLAAIMKNIIEVSELTHKKANRLWLSNIEPIILVDDLKKKYNFEYNTNNIEAIIGEYDAPELQEQGLLTYSLSKEGNTIVYGSEEVEKEKIINTIIYSLCNNYSAKDVNIYVIDYGSESVRMFNNYPQIGGLVFNGDDEKLKNVFKLIKNEMTRRKKLLVNYGGSLENYNNKNEEKLPQILLIINNYDGVLENNTDLNETVLKVARDCERYGISLFITATATSSVSSRATRAFNNKYAFRINDPSEYLFIFSKKARTLREIEGRGLFKSGNIHEFQTASIVPLEVDINDYILENCEKVNSIYKDHAPLIPALPEIVNFDLIKDSISTVESVPIGIFKESLKVAKYNFMEYSATQIVASKIENTNCFVDSLLDVLVRIKGLNIFFVDALDAFKSMNKEYEGKKIYYYGSDIEKSLETLTKVQTNPDNGRFKLLYIFYGLSKLKNKINTEKIDEFINSVKQDENSSIIFVEAIKGLKNLELEQWYTKIRNNTDGIWIGSGFLEQQPFRITKTTREMGLKYNNNYGYCVIDSYAELVKLVEFNDMLKEEEEDEE